MLRFHRCATLHPCPRQVYSFVEIHQYFEADRAANGIIRFLRRHHAIGVVTLNHFGIIYLTPYPKKAEDAGDRPVLLRFGY